MAKVIKMLHPNGLLHYIRYECDKSTFDKKPFKEMDELLKKESKNYAEKYKGMTIKETDTKVKVWYEFE